MCTKSMNANKIIKKQDLKKIKYIDLKEKNDIVIICLRGLLTPLSREL